MNMITRFAVLPALLITIMTTPASVLAVDDGVFKTVTVTADDQCAALCSGEKLCRGWSILRPDTRYPQRQCSLNNGLGDQSPFAVTPPQPLDMTIALSDMNNYRAQNSLPPVRWNDTLNTAATVHSDDMAGTDNVAHEGSDGSQSHQRVKRLGYNYSTVAENVAAGQKSWSKVFKAWQDSPGHDKNLLAPGVTEMGLALTYDPETEFITFWTMVLASPLPPHPAGGSYGIQ